MDVGGREEGLAKRGRGQIGWPAGTVAAAVVAGPQSRPSLLPQPSEHGGHAHLVPVSRAIVQLHLLLHPLQVGLQEFLEPLAVTDFILEGAAVIHHRVHPVHIDEL